MRASLLLASILSTLAAPAEAQSFEDTRARNALRDEARAEERQARARERLESLEQDRALREEQNGRNAERDARSLHRSTRLPLRP